MILLYEAMFIFTCHLFLFCHGRKQWESTGCYNWKHYRLYKIPRHGNYKIKNLVWKHSWMQVIYYSFLFRDIISIWCKYLSFCLKLVFCVPLYQLIKISGFVFTNERTERTVILFTLFIMCTWNKIYSLHWTMPKDCNSPLIFIPL